MLPSPRIPDDKSITDQLDAILMSPRFARSPQLKQLLESIVKRTLAGEEMKETTLGELLFGKTSDRNVKENSNVRTYANRLRTALEEYYDTAGRPDLVLIEIPKGGYVPSFSIREPAVPPLIVGGDSVHVQQIPVQKTNALIRPWLYALIACAALGIAVAEAIIFNTRSKTVATLPASHSRRARKSGSSFYRWYQRLLSGTCSGKRGIGGPEFSTDPRRRDGEGTASHSSSDGFELLRWIPCVPCSWW
jgi:hypothetical protein